MLTHSIVRNNSGKIFLAGYNSNNVSEYSFIKYLDDSKWETVYVADSDSDKFIKGIMVGKNDEIAIVFC